MKRVLTPILACIMFFSVSTPVLAEDAKQVVTPEAIKQIQAADEKYEKDQKKVSDVIDQVNQSVVAVIGKNAKYREDTEEEYTKYPRNLQHGSGIVIGTDGKIITNNHVVDGLEEIYVVTYDGNAYKAKLLYADEDIDMALLQINRSDLKPIKLAKETEMRVGDEVIAIGTPLFFGYRNSASRGIISGLNRPVERMYTYLQTDAAINPGNSGGPLVNMNGELVGINTLGYTSYSGMNFSIPVGDVNYFLDQYNRFGRIKRCYIGIEFEENWAAMLGLPTNQGLKAVTIRKDSVIAQGYVQEGDMLEAIDDKPVNSIAQYNEILKTHLPGDKVTLTFSRSGSKFNLPVILKEQVKDEASSNEGKVK